MKWISEGVLLVEKGDLMENKRWKSNREVKRTDFGGDMKAFDSAEVVVFDDGECRRVLKSRHGCGMGPEELYLYEGAC